MATTSDHGETEMDHAFNIMKDHIIDYKNHITLDKIYNGLVLPLFSSKRTKGGHHCQTHIGMKYSSTHGHKTLAENILSDPLRGITH